MKKTCSRCKVEYPLSAFYAKKESPDGLRYDCKFCKEANSGGDRSLRNTSPRDRSDRIRGDFKEQAHGKVKTAMKKGLLRPQSCVICKNPKTHAHHCDYSKPLNIMWLCSKHHLAWHRVLVAEV